MLAKKRWGQIKKQEECDCGQCVLNTNQSVWFAAGTVQRNTFGNGLVTEII